MIIRPSEFNLICVSITRHHYPLEVLCRVSVNKSPYFGCIPFKLVVFTKTSMLLLFNRYQFEFHSCFPVLLDFFSCIKISQGSLFDANTNIFTKVAIISRVGPLSPLIRPLDKTREITVCLSAELHRPDTEHRPEFSSLRHQS